MLREEGESNASGLGFLAGGGEMGALMRAHDWRATPIGPPETWPPPLRTAVRLILNTGHPMYIWWGPDLICFYNDAYRRSIGPERHPSSLGRPGREVWAEIWDIIGPQIEQVLSGKGATWHIDHLVPITRHGVVEDVYWTYSYSPIDDESAPDGIGGVLVVCSETTEQVVARHELQVQRDQFSKLFDLTPTFMALLRGPEHRFELANPGYLKLIGNRPVIGLPVAEALPEVGQQGYLSILDEVFRSGKPFTANAARYIFKYQGAPETERFLDFVYQPIFDESGAVGGIFVQGADVTARVLAEAQLRQSNETLERRVSEALAERKLMADLVESTDTFIQALDTDYRFLAINKANALEYEKTYGFRPRLGERLLDLLTPENRGPVQAVWSRALSGETFTEIAEFGDPDVGTGWYEIKFRPLYDSEGAIIGAYQFSTDVTQRLNDQRRLAEAEEQLRQSQKMEALGQLTGGIAHDFNNLLTGIVGNLELLQRRLSEGRMAGAERHISAAQGAARRAATLTQRLLAFSRRQTLDPRPTDVNKLIGGMADLIHRSTGPEVEVVVTAASGLWLTKVDQPQLENALLNLCINARDAMTPGGGRLTIETSNRWFDEREAEEKDLSPGQYIALSVTDTGSGMSERTIARAFDPFFTTKPLGEGTGLGLSMVHGFVRQSDGQVAIHSELGKGTTICLYLPRFVGENDLVEADAIVDPGVSQGEAVLVVDDDPAVRMLIVEVLEENGYAVIEADQGQAALDILQSDRRIDLMITDFGLPGGLNGGQLADAARALRPLLKILLITGFAENAALREGRSPSGAQVMTKPFSLTGLAHKVRDLLDHG